MRTHAQTLTHNYCTEEICVIPKIGSSTNSAAWSGKKRCWTKQSPIVSLQAIPHHHYPIQMQTHLDCRGCEGNFTVINIKIKRVYQAEKSPSAKPFRNNNPGEPLWEGPIPVATSGNTQGLPIASSPHVDIAFKCVLKIPCRLAPY